MAYTNVRVTSPKVAALEWAVQGVNFAELHKDEIIRSKIDGPATLGGFKTTGFRICGRNCEIRECSNGFANEFFGIADGAIGGSPYRTGVLLCGW